jgi:hypothetical protein
MLPLFSLNSLLFASSKSRIFLDSLFFRFKKAVVNRPYFIFVHNKNLLQTIAKGIILLGNQIAKKKEEIRNMISEQYKR